MTTLTVKDIERNAARRVGAPCMAAAIDARINLRLDQRLRLTDADTR